MKPGNRIRRRFSRNGRKPNRIRISKRTAATSLVKRAKQINFENVHLKIVHAAVLVDMTLMLVNVILIKIASLHF